MGLVGVIQHGPSSGWVAADTTPCGQPWFTRIYVGLAWAKDKLAAGQRGGVATTPPRSSWTTTPRRRGGGASHSGCARLVATSVSPACQRWRNASGE